MKKILTLIAAVCCTMGMMAANVGDTIPYYYKGDTLWYKLQSTSYAQLIRPASNGYGTHTKPSGVVYVPDSIEIDGAKKRVYYPSMTFYGLKNIDEVYIEDKGAENFNSLFYNSSVKKVHIPASVSGFGNATFSGCTQLDSVILDDPDHFIYTAYNTWSSNTKLYSSLGNNEFLRLGNGVYSYKGLATDSIVTIPEGVKYAAGYLTFVNGSTTDAKIKSAVLPSTMTKLGFYIFFYCTNITSVTCLATIPPTADPGTFYTSDNSSKTDLRTQATLYVPYSADHSILNAYKAADVWKEFSNILEIGVPTYNVNLTIDNAKYGSVTLNGKAYTAGACRFAEGDEITIVATPNVKGLFEQIKLGDTDLTTEYNTNGKIIISSLTQDTALYVRFALNPDAPAAIGDTIPYYYKGDTLWYYIQTSDYVNLVRPTTSGYGIHIEPSGVVYVPDSIVVNGAKKRVKYTFMAFYSLKNIDEVYIEDKGLESLSYTFRNSSVKKVHIPASISGFGNGSFADCAQLDSVILDDPDHFVNCAYDTWSKNTKLYSSLGDNEFLRLGNGVYSYKGLATDSIVTIPEGVKYAGAYLLHINGSTKNAKIQSVVLPSTMTRLDTYLFFDCTNITKVTCLATVPPTADLRTFYTSDNSSKTDLRTQATLYVPYSADHSILNAYKAADVWKEFVNIVEIEDTPTDIESAEQSVSYQKVIRNGQLLIMRNNNIYDATGRMIR